MDFKSKYFDGIRIGKGGSKAGGKRAGKARQERRDTACQWEGCEQPATHKAPMGRAHEGEYLKFCFDHVREYNKSYNYFSGLDDDAIAKFQKEAMTGHRPTWTMGVNRTGEDDPPPLGGAGWSASNRVRARLYRDRPSTSARPRKLRTLERKAFEDMRLPHNATADAIKARYKELVKRHHPDANGGDRSSEERLRQIIQAYKFLKQAGFC